MTGTVRFRDLGTLVLDREDTPLPVNGIRLVAALALLLVHAGRHVSVDALAEAMWGGQATPRSASTLDSHIWRLRRLLEPDRGRGAPAELLLRDAAGYRLLATTDQVDSMRFARLADEAVALLADGQPERVLRRTDEALALWRGTPFTPVSDEPWARPAVARLEELHAQVRERRIEALIAVGDPERALADLEPAIAAAPLRERLWAHRMLAAYRCGRTEQALAAFRAARELLLDEVGVEPGPELRGLQARILAEDPALLGPARTVAGRQRPQETAPDRAVEVHLPVRHTRMIGRDDERDRIAALLAAHPLVTIVGTAGCGKTRLAIEAARAVAPRFPDGVWAVDLTTAEGGDQVLPTIASAVGLAVPTAGTFADALRAFSRGRRMLLLLDNGEHVLDDVAELVDSLLVDGTELAVLCTSREPLDIDGEVVWSLAPLPLPDPDADARTSPAVALFLERLGAADRALGATVLDDPQCLELAVRICRAVDGVPLAMELAAARARAFTLDEIAEQVGTDASALARIGRGRPEHRKADHHRTVRFAVEQSYRVLPADEAALHRAVSVVPGPFTPALAAALAALPIGDTHELLARLVHRSLLVSLGPAGPGRPTRFAQLATVRGHAAHAAGQDPVADPDALTARRDRWVEELVTAHPRLGRPGEVGWFAALDDDLVALRATLHRNLVDAPSRCGVRIASRLGLYWYYRGMMVEARHWQERATSVADGMPLDRALVRYMLGGSLAMDGRPDLGLPLIAAGHDAVRGTPDEHAPLRGEVLAILSGALFVAEQDEAGRANTADVREIAVATPDGSLDLLADLSTLLSGAGTAQPEQVIDRASAVYDDAVAGDNSFVAWMASEAAVNAALAGGDVESGLRWSDRMVSQHRALRVREGPTLLELRADLLALADDAPAAVRLFAAARAHSQRAGLRWPSREITTELVARATDALDRVEFEDAWQQGGRMSLDDLGVTVVERAPLRPG
ncbi:BTAD domain-containing putative transcriptional regulator [Pseudonocardia charpentierae]|uniref:BTAD domain-containing putative transcriptional regulator n=1 Tax=Pseudonocardia charpentierae TaxID=3075545 RepID=A0ABU2N8V1_9PSEU|nr:BTAD domain-containing putative transcriptional regulator [Pseudonocardia sp. DSM 45834]MDT0350161.1 BTAD domain-containing putative transcriptional regulator [Pseudonocardia sp. DSM 45834]